jgi:hypothetical protein
MAFMEGRTKSAAWWCEYYHSLLIPIPFNSDVVCATFRRGHTECLQLIYLASLLPTNRTFPNICEDIIETASCRGYISTLQWLWGKRKYLTFTESRKYILAACLRNKPDVLRWFYERRTAMPFRYPGDILCRLINKNCSPDIVKWWWLHRDELDLAIPPLAITHISPILAEIICNDVHIDLQFTFQKVKFNECSICLADENDMLGIRIKCGHNYRYCGINK